MTVPLPNVRKLFIPDEGMRIYEADLAGADAQVVAAEANDVDLRTAFKEGLDVHAKNATDLWGTSFTLLEGSARSKRRKECKQAVHATNYGAAARTIATILNWRIHEADDFQSRWFRLHPGIREWHRRVEGLVRKRNVPNPFGYRIIYFDRIDALLPQALAWIPQSTVALVCFKGALQLQDKIPEVEILLQVHDSLVFQLPINSPRTHSEIQNALTVPVPYPDPLVIQWNLKTSTKSWGEVE